MKLFDHIKANNFFPIFCPGVRNYQAKIRGKNTRGTPLGFSADDQVQIADGLNLMNKLAQESLKKNPSDILVP